MNHIFAVRDYLRTHVEYLNELNCDIDNNGVFDEASMSADTNPYCVVISHSFSDEAYQRANTNSVLFDWRVLINFFRLLEGSRDDNAEQIQDAYLRTREIIDALCADFSLDGAVIDGQIHSVLTPMTYNRNDRDEFVMIGVMLIIKEDLNG